MCQRGVKEADNSEKVSLTKPHARLDPNCSEAENEQLTTTERKHLIKDLSDILTIDKGIIEKYISKLTHHELVSLRNALSKEIVTAYKASRKWRSYSMSMLPHSNVERRDDGLLQIINTKSTDSLIFIDTKSIDSDHPRIKSRQALVKVLRDLLDDQTFSKYETLLVSGGASDVLAAQPNSLDIGVSTVISKIEQIFLETYDVIALETRENLINHGYDLDPSTPTPSALEGSIAMQASEKIIDILIKTGVYTEKELQPQNIKNWLLDEGNFTDLVLRLLINISVNRAILEWICLEKSSKHALSINLKLVEAFAHKGVNEIPWDINNDDIRTSLERWFGKEGILINDQFFGGKYLKPKDIDLVITLATHAQDFYALYRVPRSKDEHSKPYNRLIFALVSTALYLSGERVYDMRNPTKRVNAFPAQNLRKNSSSKPRETKPHRHVLDLLANMYGQLFFGIIRQPSSDIEESNLCMNVPNKVDLLDSKALIEYVKSKDERRNILITTLYACFKFAPPEKILLMYQKLCSVTE